MDPLLYSSLIIFSSTNSEREQSTLKFSNPSIIAILNQNLIPSDDEIGYAFGNLKDRTTFCRWINENPNILINNTVISEIFNKIKNIKNPNFNKNELIFELKQIIDFNSLDS